MKLAVALAILIAATPTLGYAEASIYRGTIGDKDVVVEFSDEPAPGSTEIFGRYFYVDQGIDIPLRSIKAQRSRLGLAEEVACSEERNNCPHAQDDPPADPPLGAKWDLKVSDDREHLQGEFKLNGRNVPVDLTIYGFREFDISTGLYGLTEFASGLWYQGTTLTAETSPYDYLKVTALKFTEGEVVEMTGGTFRYLTDPRTKFQFPRIVTLDDGDPAAANQYLEQRHWKMSLDALYCVSQQYQGFGWNGFNYDAGTLGWWDEELIEVHYLSPTVMTWMESGSLSCGGAHPYNHAEYYNLDVATGMPLDLSRIFKGWVAKDYNGDIVDLETARANPRDYQWQPDEELAAFVREHRKIDASVTEECPIDELIGTNLMIGFNGDDHVVFGLGALPHVISACGENLYEAPLSELGDLLTPEAADYFPALEN
jgi:hypothetical protein